MDLHVEPAVVASPAVAAGMSSPREAALPPSPRIYRASPALVMYGVAIFTVIILLGVLFGRPVSGLVVLVIGVSLALFLALLTLLISLSARLVLTAEGLEYQTLGSRLRVPWEGVVGVGKATLGGGVAEVLALRQHALKVSRGRTFGLAALPVAKSVSLLAWQADAPAEGTLDGYVIPLSYFEHDWRRGTLLREIGQRAPALASEKVLVTETGQKALRF
jgi:hypothetical protein